MQKLMRNRTGRPIAGGFTLIELLVVIAIIALLMAILLPALGRAREQGKRAVCLHNLGQIMIAWNMYADENAEKIPGTYTTYCICQYSIPDAGCADGVPPQNGHASYPSWVETPHVWNTNLEPSLGSKQSPHNYKVIADGATSIDGPFSEGSWKHGIACGSLWKYIKDFKLYACPVGDRGQMITYTGVDPPNGGWSIGSSPCNWLGGDEGSSKKYRSQFKNTANRLVFLDEGKVSWCSWTFRNQGSDLAIANWFDCPPVRHGNGTTLAFVDGHADYHKWVHRGTVEVGKKCPGCAAANGGTLPGGCQTSCNKDYFYMAKIICGKVNPIWPVTPAGCTLE